MLMLVYLCKGKHIVDIDSSFGKIFKQIYCDFMAKV
jgi:hypothetical protein